MWEVLLFAFSLIWFFVLFYKVVSEFNRLQTDNESLGEKELLITQLQTELDSINKEAKHQKGRAASAHTNKGLILEKWFPFMEHGDIEEHWKTMNWSFLGNPIDYIIFDWDKDVENNKQNGKVVFLDVKSGNSSLSTKQRRIRDLIIEGNVEWREIKLE